MEERNPGRTHTFMYVRVAVHVFLSFYINIKLSIYIIFIYQSIFINIHLSIYLYQNLSINLTIYIDGWTDMFLYLYICGIANIDICMYR